MFIYETPDVVHNATLAITILSIKYKICSRAAATAAPNVGSNQPWEASEGLLIVHPATKHQLQHLLQ